MEKEANKRHHESEEDSGNSEVSDNASTGEPATKTAKLNDRKNENTVEEDESKPGKGTNTKGATSSEPNMAQNLTSTQFLSVEELKVEKGDLVQINRGMYSHYGMYVGDGMLIHVTGPNGDIAAKEAEVKKATLKEVAGDSLVRVNNMTKQAEAHKVEALDVDTMLANAEKDLGKTVEYNLISRNCEHFVTEWRYNKAWSLQVNTGLSFLSALSAPAPTSTGQTAPPNNISAAAHPALQLLSMFAKPPVKKDSSPNTS